MAANRPDERPPPWLPTEEAEAEVLAGGPPGRLASLVLGLRQAAVQVVQRVQDVRPQKLDMSWVTESLAVGGAFQARDVRRLRAQGVTAVLDLRAEATDDVTLLAEQGMAFAHLDIQTTPARRTRRSSRAWSGCSPSKRRAVRCSSIAAWGPDAAR